MDILKNITEYIQQAEKRDLLIYIGASIGFYLILLLSIWYITRRQTHYYHQAIQKVQRSNQEVQRLLQDAALVQEQQKQVEEILQKNANFRILPTYETALAELQLTRNQGDEKPVTQDGAVVNGTIEKLLVSNVSNITMKQLTDLLMKLTTIPQIYPKELIVKRNPRGQLVDIELTVATLEPQEIS